MKKVAILIFATTTLLLLSCQRDYTCECGKVYNSHQLGRFHGTHGAAVKWCEGKNDTLPDSLKCILHN